MEKTSLRWKGTFFSLPCVSKRTFTKRSRSLSTNRTASDYTRQDEDETVRLCERFVETGEKERLQELLRRQLVVCGWREEMRRQCKEVIRTKGIDQVTVEDLVEAITHRGRALVPNDVKTDLLDAIKAFILKEVEMTLE